VAVTDPLSLSSQQQQQQQLGRNSDGDARNAETMAGPGSLSCDARAATLNGGGAPKRARGADGLDGQWWRVRRDVAAAERGLVDTSHHAGRPRPPTFLFLSVLALVSSRGPRCSVFFSLGSGPAWPRSPGLRLRASCSTVITGAARCVA
jgi:hypothetical protein